MDPDSRPTIPGFELLDTLGERSLGTVYKARQVSLNRIVAIRIMEPDTHQAQACLERMEAQAQAATLHHANITHVLEAGQHEGLHYLVMEYVSGYSLASKLKRHKPVTAAEALVVITAAAGALNHAWGRASIIHGDLRPENLLVDDDGTVKVSDFMGFSFQRRLGSLTTDQLSDNPYYDYTDANIAEPTQAMDMEALGRVVFHAMTGNLLPRENEETQIRTAFLQIAQLHPDPGTRDLAPGLGNLLVQLICTGQEQALATWDAVAKAAGTVTVAPVEETQQGLTPLPAGNAPQDLLTLAGNARPRPRKPVIRRTELHTEPVKLRAKKKNHVVALAITVLIWGGIAYGVYLSDQKWSLGIADQAKVLWSRVMDQMGQASEQEERTLTQSDSSAEGEGSLTLPPPITSETDSQRPEEVDEPLAMDAGMEEDLGRDESFTEADSFEDQPTVGEFHDYASGMERVFAFSRKRAYDKASGSITAWLKSNPNHHYAAVMQANTERMKTAAALFQLLEDNSAVLVGQTITDNGREGVIQSIGKGTIRVKQTIKGVEVPIDVPLRGLSNSDFARMLRVVAPKAYDQNVATYLISICRFDSGSEYLNRMIRPREAKAALTTWKEEWQQAWNNARAHQALLEVERLIRDGEMPRAKTLLEKAQADFRETDVMQWSDYEKVATFEETLRGVSASPAPSAAKSPPRSSPVTLDSDVDKKKPTGNPVRGRPPMIELDISRSKKTRKNENGDSDDQKQNVSIEVTIKNKEFRDSFHDLTSEIYVVAVSASDRDAFKLIIQESRNRVELPVGGTHSFQTKSVKLTFDDHAYARHGFKYYGYLYLLKDSAGSVLISKASKPKLSTNFTTFSGLQEQTEFTM